MDTSLTTPVTQEAPAKAGFNEADLHSDRLEMVQPGTAYKITSGVLNARSLNTFREVWRCTHDHTDVDQAYQCAQVELARRMQ